jgi:AcrR family transcriptional regulator
LARRPEEDAAEGDSDSLPEWKRQSIDRSLQVARARAQERSGRFVEAALELMQDRGSTDFTVQDVVDHSRMSIRTFYNFFASKDDLLVAVHETILADHVTPHVRARCEAESDPVERVRAFIEGLVELATDAGPVSRALTTYQNRLAETRPDDLDRAFQPQIELVIELVSDVAAAGQLHSDLSSEKAARLLHHTVLAAVHARILGHGNGLTGEELWRFCASGLGG